MINDLDFWRILTHHWNWVWFLILGGGAGAAGEKLMAFAIVILGLIAAGVYTGAWGFYLFAAFAGFAWFMSICAVAAIAAVAKDAAAKGTLNVKRTGRR